jgi:hypothetical protein
MRPVENAPNKKYFKEASLLFKFLLSLPVKIYSGIEMISIPRKSINKERKEEDKVIPQRTKNINEKYSL